jgi:ADP-ribose pyrophosphatase
MECNKLIRLSVKSLIFYDDKFLILRKNTVEGLWDFPGGRLEFGEAPEETLKREIKEETNLRVSILRPLYSWNYLKNEDTFLVGFVYLSKTNSKEVLLSSEHNNYDWITFEELSKYKIAPSYLVNLKKLNFDDIINSLK